jgi:hypothetical protein
VSSTGEIPSRGATVEGCEEKTVEYSDELTTISTIAPRLDNHSPLNWVSNNDSHNVTKLRATVRLRQAGLPKPHKKTALALERITTKTKGSNNDFLHSTLRSHYQPFCEEEDFSVSDKEPPAWGVCKWLRLARGW